MKCRKRKLDGKNVTERNMERHRQEGKARRKVKNPIYWTDANKINVRELPVTPGISTCSSNTGDTSHRICTFLLVEFEINFSNLQPISPAATYVEFRSIKHARLIYVNSQ